VSPRTRISDVARLAGVAPSTVSAVLNDVSGARVKDSTRERVRRAADELGYAPNALARGLRTRRSGTLALISDVIATTPYAGQLIQGAQDAAWEAGHVLMVVNTGGDAAIERRAMAVLRQQQVGGVLWATMSHRVVPAPVPPHGTPLVLLDARDEASVVPSVVPDEEAGARAAVAELAAHGHRRIGFVLDRNDSPASEGRTAGYRAALAERGLPVEDALVARAQSDSTGGEAAAGVLLDRPDPPTAIFAFTDQMAVGVYHAAAARRLRIPADLSVVGFDDLAVLAQELRPGLSSVALPHYAMGEIAAATLLRLVEDPAAEVPAVQRVPTRIVRRASVGPAPRA
jgi:LacI family transcriptional regulator